MINVVYPRQGHKTFESATFLMGQVTTGSVLHINGEQALTSPSGFFNHYVSLKEGVNRFDLHSDGAREKIFVTRHASYAVLPKTPIQYHPDTIQPADNLVCQPEESFHVAIAASVDSKVSVTVPGLIDKPQPLKPYSGSTVGDYVDTREEIFKKLHQTKRLIPVDGYYMGDIKIPEGVGPQGDLPIKIHILNDTGHESVTLNATLSIKPGLQGADISDDRAVLSEELDGERLSPLREGALVFLTGAMGLQYRVALSENHTGWISGQGCQLVKLQNDRPQVFIQSVTVQPG